MADKTLKHFVFSRFFPAQDSNYLYNILAPAFLNEQLPLAKNMLMSLENQTNQNFEVVFVANPKFFNNPKYEFVFTELQNQTSLPLKFVTPNNMSALVKEAYEHYDFVIQSHMDFDDFVFKDAIADTQSKVNECNDILVYGFGKGYIYSNNELYAFLPTERKYLVNNIGHPGIIQSLILKSSYAKVLPFDMLIVKLTHSKLMTKLQEIFEQHNIKFPEGVYQKNISANAIIYFRHEFARETLKGANKIRGKKILTTEEDGITKKWMEDEFNFHYDLKSIK